MFTILIIDDHRDYRLNLAEILNSEGYITINAENGLIGIQMIRHYSPDLILCDVDMPVMDGIEVLRKIKTESEFAKIPFIILSANGNERIVETAHDLEVTAYLTKSITISALLRMITRSLYLEGVDESTE